MQHHRDFLKQIAYLGTGNYRGETVTLVPEGYVVESTGATYKELDQVIDTIDEVCRPHDTTTWHYVITWHWKGLSPDHWRKEHTLHHLEQLTDTEALWEAKDWLLDNQVLESITVYRVDRYMMGVIKP